MKHSVIMCTGIHGHLKPEVQVRSFRQLSPNIPPTAASRPRCYRLGEGRCDQSTIAHEMRCVWAMALDENSVESEGDENS